MYRTDSLSLVATILSMFAHFINAIVLQDLPHFSERGRATRSNRLFGRQVDHQALELQNTESFLWGGNNGSNAILGNLTVSMPGATENIISMQRFKGMTKSVTCSTSNIDIAFNDNTTFVYAKNIWDWVNGADNHTFVMVVGTGDCGWNEHRIPFTVSTLDYDDATMTASLTANASEWSDAIHSYTLDVGAMPVAAPSTKFRRGFGDVDFNKDLSLDFDHVLPSASITIPTPDFSVTFACVSCGTTGSFDFGFHLETIFLVPHKAYATLNPKGVSLAINPKATLSTDLSSPLTLSQDLFTIPLGGIIIPGGILDVGPEIVFSAGLSIGPLTGSASISSGVTISVPDSASLTVDILASDISSTGWNAVVSKQPMVVSAQLSGAIKAYVKAQIQLTAKAFGQGFDTGIGIDPYVSASLAAIVSTGGACKGDPLKHALGVSASTSFGVEVVADIEVDDQTLVSATITGVSIPLANVCLPFGPLLVQQSSSSLDTIASVKLSSSANPSSTIQSSLPSITPVISTKSTSAELTTLSTSSTTLSTSLSISGTSSLTSTTMTTSIISTPSTQTLVSTIDTPDTPDSPDTPDTPDIISSTISSSATYTAPSQSYTSWTSSK